MHAVSVCQLPLIFEESITKPILSQTKPNIKLAITQPNQGGMWNGLHWSYGILIPYEQYSIRTFCSLWEKISIILFLWNIYLYNILLSLFVRMEYLLFVCMEYLLFVRMEYSLFIYILLYDIINKCYCCY